MIKAILQLGWGTVVDRVALEQIFVIFTSYQRQVQ